ncbi:helix-turn-helix domain-containing protein [Flavivirga aquimarina]|uniref:Helix-turn-helix domain-containing protein n=1 Tax=Flavivirga aquimarina TaxID=2027862 RepID=A0ABT8WE07_9FLAO|nr:helix-turn-helix domain-containing protein [Flavivirga aquimarina]MDO5971399.1 helix-turn-helix domain-containing protein [Flavivirga aquimarina]
MEKLEFRTKLIEVRKAKGLTQVDVAEKSRITVRTIQRIESGIVKPRAFTIKIISETLGFDFYDSSDICHDVILNQNSKLKRHTIFWYVKDLFNLKTNTMKKISILSTTSLIIVLGLFSFNSEIFAQTSNKKNSITVQKNMDKSIKRIDVRFTNYLTYDSLISIKNHLKAYDIKINYKKIEFDEDNRLKDISLEAFTKLGSGSFSMPLSDITKTGGFFVDYSKNTKTKFCIGGCDL